MFRGAMVDLGQTIGNYLVTAKLGEGAMGIVYLGEHPVIGRKVAIKVIHPEHARSAEVVARFVNEAKSINDIRHEHIVDITDFGRTDGGDFYFIMENLEGEPLSSFIEREAPFPVARALAVAGQIADALVASHAHGVIHRDLKPENIFLVPRPSDADFVKVLDFGLAKLLHAQPAYETHAGIVMGTPYYMAPEQCEGRVEIDERADVYSLGVVLFEMLTGRVPFGGESYGEVISKQMTMRPPTASSLVADVPDAIEAVLQRALAKAPEERFASMAAFRDALLDPMNQSGALPAAELKADQTGRMRAARPMARSELALKPPVAPRPPSTFRASAGEIGAVGATDVPLEPARNRSRSYVLVASVALVAGVLVAGITHGHAAALTTAALSSMVTPAAAPKAKTVAVSFSSDPDGVDVRAADGTPLGTTPLSIQVPTSDAPADYVFHKAGYADKTMSLIPSVPSALFALLRPEAPMPGLQPAPLPSGSPTSEASPPIDDPPTTAREAAPPREQHHHHRHVHAPSDDDPSPAVDEDGVLEPSFVN